MPPASTWASQRTAGGAADGRGAFAAAAAGCCGPGAGHHQRGGTRTVMQVIQVHGTPHSPNIQMMPPWLGAGRCLSGGPPARAHPPDRPAWCRRRSAPGRPRNPAYTATYCLPSVLAVGDRLVNTTPEPTLNFESTSPVRASTDLNQAVKRAVEGHVTASHQGTAPVGKRFLVLPHLLAGGRIPGHEGTEAARSCRIRAVHADKGCALQPRGMPGGVVHADAVRRRVSRKGARGEYAGGEDGLPAFQARADVLDVPLGSPGLLGRV